MAASYEKLTADFAALLANDDEAGVTKLAKDLLESPEPAVKGVACLGVAKLRLQTELTLHGPESQVFAPANEALKFFKEADERHGEASALNTLAQAYLISGDSATAVSTAKDAGRLANGFRDKTLAAAVQDTLYQAHTAQGDAAKALLAAKERVSLLDSIGSEEETGLRARADALSILADLQLKRGMKEASKATAEKMAAICEKLGDKERQALANKCISTVLVQSGKADQAPNRIKALAALQRCMGAVERRASDDFKKWWYEVEDLGGVDRRDVEKELSKLREHGDPQGIDNFLREVDFPYVEKATGQVIHEFTRRHFYINFRVGGIQYGPRFQCVTGYRVGDEGGKALAHLRPCSQSDAWELQIGYHTGILDGTLQSGACFSSPVY